MKSKDTLAWLPIYIDKWLFGSTRCELEVDERSVWMDLLLLSGKDQGFIRANEQCPYPIPQLAGMLGLPTVLLEKTIQKCIEKGKLELMQDGSLYVKSWPEYSLSERYKRKLRATQREENIPPITPLKEEEKKRIEENIGGPRNGPEAEHRTGKAALRTQNGTNPFIKFQCDAFIITAQYHDELQKEWPLIDLPDLYARLKNDTIDNPTRYKRNGNGRLKNLRNIMRNWLIRARVKPPAPKIEGDYPKFKHDPAMDQAMKEIGKAWKK